MNILDNELFEHFGIEIDKSRFSSFSCIGSDRNGLNGLENSLGSGGSLLTGVNDLDGVSATAVLGQPPWKLDASRVEIVNGPVRRLARLEAPAGAGKSCEWRTGEEND